MALMYSLYHKIKYTRFQNGTNKYIPFDDTSKESFSLLRKAAKKDVVGIYNYIKNIYKSSII